MGELVAVGDVVFYGVLAVYLMVGAAVAFMFWRA
jgi:hypothetical protein